MRRHSGSITLMLVIALLLAPLAQAVMCMGMAESAGATEMAMMVGDHGAPDAYDSETMGSGSDSNCQKHGNYLDCCATCGGPAIPASLDALNNSFGAHNTPLVNVPVPPHSHREPRPPRLFP